VTHAPAEMRGSAIDYFIYTSRPGGVRVKGRLGRLSDI
jgi:hypothetical protein